MNKFIGPMTLPLRPSLETKKYHQTPTPGPVDRWLTTVSRSPRIDFLKDYLMIGDVVTEHVLCLVELECIEVPQTDSLFADPPMYTLYITASLSPETCALLFLRKSPRAILDQFVGFKEDGYAPEWTRWTQPTLEFQQPKATFADLFVQMATWDVNAIRPGLSYKMAQWARSITIGTKIISKEFIPITPRTVRFVDNPAPVFKKGPSMYAGGCQDRSPTKGLCERLGAMVIQSDGDSCDEDFDMKSEAKLLDFGQLYTQRPDARPLSDSDYIFVDEV